MARNTMKKSFSLKDHLFNEDKVRYLASLFAARSKTFKSEAFIAEVMQELHRKELKERIVLIAEVLRVYLPEDFEQAAYAIVKALPKPLDANLSDDDYGDFIFAPLGEYVARYGTHKEHVHVSLQTIYEITQRFSMEDTIRTFLNLYPKETLQFLTKCSTDSHYHVRRLASEGTRPYLPWSKRLLLPYTDMLPILHTLYADKTRYVTRSVANHLNDIAKIDARGAVQTLRAWKKEGKQDPQELAWMTRHALRTLIKRGDKDALKLLGYDTNPEVIVERFSLKASSKKIAPGETLSFNVDLRSEKKQKLVIDYSIDFLKANGKAKPKVFKLKSVVLEKGETLPLSKSHTLLKDATTFTLYAGKHKVTLLVNGAKMGEQMFTIL